MQFNIDVANGLMYVSGVGAAIVTSSLSANIANVVFGDGSGGMLYYNDRPAVPVPFSDPSPYQSYFNSWITAAGAATPALTLLQAQVLKSALVNSIYIVKRQLPVSVPTSAGTFAWDASDTAVARMGLQTGLSTIKLLPIGATVPASLSAADLKAIITAVVAQNVKYQPISAAKQAAVNVLSTIAAVATYDATAGW